MKNALRERFRTEVSDDVFHVGPGRGQALGLEPGALHESPNFLLRRGQQCGRPRVQRFRAPALFGQRPPVTVELAGSGACRRGAFEIIAR